MHKKTEMLQVYISDLEHMGAELVLERVIHRTVVSRKYEGKLKFENALYYVYVEENFYQGPRLSGIAAPMYHNREYAVLACMRLNAEYQKALKANRNNIRLKQRHRLWGEIAVHAILFILMGMYLYRIIWIAQFGLSDVSYVLSLLYPAIFVLCYIIHYRLQ